MKLTKKKAGREYLLGKKTDIQESDPGHRLLTEQMYLYLTHKNKHWVKIDCVIDGKLLPPQEIHKKVIEILQKRSVIDK
jgi:hypothetical protein